MNGPAIFTVTTVHLREPRFGASPRTVAWFADLATATECVIQNWGDIFETTYSYAVIEEVPSGLYPHASAEYWFKWHGSVDEGGYETCDKPSELNGVVGFAIG